LSILAQSAVQAAQTSDGEEAFCFNGGIENAWDCSRSAPSDGAYDHEYHTLKIVLDKNQDDTALGQVLPIERIGEVPLPGGERVVFLGRFRDSMKAFRVVEKCREEHAAECGQFAPKVVRIGMQDEPDPVPPGRVQLAALDLQTKTAGELIGIKTAALDLSEDVIGKSIQQNLGTPRPKGLIRLPDSLEHVLWVDLKEGNLHVLQREKDQYRLAETMSVSIGKAGYGKVRQGDKKTPVGVYRLLSHLTDEQLDDFYGSGAYTLNYPNALDRIKQRNGSGIWLHGLPKGKEHRPLQDSDGCVVLSNSMIEGIGGYVDLQTTPIILDDQLEWVDAKAMDGFRRELEQAIESWRRAWSAIDNERYLGFYAADFTDLEKDLAAWRRYKTRIHKAKDFIEVNISDVSLIAYPGEKNTVLARFYQRYNSSNFIAAGWKEQLWRKEGDGQWRIVYERG
jgi:murein L,D-transpeptidase YafK